MKPYKILFTFYCFALLLLSIESYSQSNNLCPQGSVPTLNVNPCTGSTDYTIDQAWTVDNTANVSNNTACVTSANNRRDGWFKFVATSTTTSVVATVASGTRNVALAAYTGACGSMTEVACINAGGNGTTETLTFATVIGTTYYIRVIRINSGFTGNDMDGTIDVVTAVTNDNCVTATPLTPGAVGAACAPVCTGVFGATASTPATGCSGTANDDVWFSFTATQISHVITVDGAPNFNAVVELLGGACGGLTNLACADLTGNGGVETLTFNNLVAGNTYYIRVYDYDNNVPGDFEFNICVTSPVIPTCPASLGGGVVNIANLPYVSIGRSTNGKGNDITALNALVCGNSNYYQGLDEVFVFTPALSGNLSISLTSGSSNVGIMLYDGCPFIGQGGSCVDYSQSSSGNQFICTNVIAGHTYYLVVDRNSANSLNNYNISISAPSPGGAPGSTCANAVTIASLPFNITNQTTQCKGNDYTNSSTGSCTSLYESGEDMVFAYTALGSECIRITLSNTNSTQAGFQLYENCPGSPGANCLGFIGGGNVAGNFSLPGPGTYYIIVDSWDPPSSVIFDLNVSTSLATSPNDFPCNAITLPIGVNVNGNNSCSSGSLEPAAPSCWTSGELNTVWYKVVPTTTSLIIKTFLGTLSNTQIALYQGACGSLTQVAPNSSSCNQDISCGLNSTNNSQITVNGLTIGQTYYIRVDGENDMTGTFGILAVNTSSGLPPVYGQECISPVPVCQNSVNVGNPGYTAFGNACDFSAFQNCLASGERASAWYTIPIGVDGTLEFDIVPNDWLGAPSTVSTDYDFAIWEIGASGLQCSQLGSTAPVRCNYSALGLSGCSGTGNSPGMYPGFNGSYESAINVLAGQVYLLEVSNYTNSTSGFTLNFSSVPDPVNYSATPGTMTWLGGTNTSWAVAGNWGACNIPNCAVDAVVNSTSINQPTVLANQTVNSIVINAGASLTINPNVTLSVCGDFTNNGSFIALPGSTVKFVGSGTQTISGNLTGVNGFANMTMEKPAGTLLINSDITIKESDSLKSGFFDPNAKIIRVGKNFYNFDGISTHLSPATGSTYIFNGSVNQNFTNLDDDIVLDNVQMSQTGAFSLILGAGVNNNLNIAGNLTLTNGKIVTGAREVVVTNPANAAVSPGNINSYVEGNLRRSLNNNATGIYDFPVGHAAGGYQLARVDFTSPTQIPEISAHFSTWPAVPNGPVASECVLADYSPNQALNHGYWTLEASANGNTGMYDLSVFNRSYTNAASPGGWTVMKRMPAGSGAWSLDGSCVLTSTLAITQRIGMTDFGDFGTAQSTSPLPIELLMFDASVVPKGVQCVWKTASETNNDYFVIEKSANGITFETVGTVDGAGTTSELHSYSCLDKDPYKGLSYYRLKQVDFDGVYTYSEIVAVRIKGSLGDIHIYPNPVNEVLQYDFDLEQSGKIQIQILDVLGNIVAEEQKDFHAGIVHSDFQVKDLSDGVYYLKISSDQLNSKTKFIKYRK
ncbi:MAG: T9SS type A sorting domain-containing protein [Bacteroidetes bacterium]|nr:T9SS type A sorting domain-containing protein [Bacteroidota bacterium]